MRAVLRINNLAMPDDFPAPAYERVWGRISPLSTTRNALYVEFANAWNALAYRYLAMAGHGDDFKTSVIVDGTSPLSDRRYYQEQCLFDFFSSGYSAFDSFFYGAFVVGAFLEPATFPLITEKDQRRVSGVHTVSCYQRAFAQNAVSTSLGALAASPEYGEWRDIRNVLTHRAAPGRTLHVSPGREDETPVDRWKLLDIPLDERMITQRRAHASRLLTASLAVVADFVEERF